MKALLRLALAVLILAGVVTFPTSANGYTFGTQPIGSFELQCAQFCMVALCPEPQTCGVFINSNGQRNCGCHGGIGVIGS